MKSRHQIITLCLSLALLVASTIASEGFALLGPIQPWMQVTNGVIVPGDIGGPMCLSNGYRWNVPVVTYGFDPSFLAYFGSNGVAVVQSAVQILNDLPPASQLVLTNYPLDSLKLNSAAQAQSLYDLKSQTLSLLLEHLGLAQPTRYIFVIQEWNPLLLSDPPISEGPPPESEWTDGIITNYIVQRNYDPQTLNVTTEINETIYTAEIAVFGDQSLVVVPFTVDMNAGVHDPVAGFSLEYGSYYSGLTYDDVGGLAFLLSTNTVNYETLLPGVAGVGTNANAFVNGAWRPGVDKTTFMPQPMDSTSGAFLPTTNLYTDSYLTNGMLVQQQVARVVTRPDFLFGVGDSAAYGYGINYYSRTGTTNWLDNAAANGNTNGAGPGVIAPPVQILFNKLGPVLLSEGNVSGTQISVSSLQYWGSFDGSTNAPLVYPVPQAGPNQMTLHMWLGFGTTFQNAFDWKPVSLPGAQFALQTSTNLIAWTTLFTVTNNGSVTTYLNLNPTNASGFYRLIPQ